MLMLKSYNPKILVFLSGLCLLLSLLTLWMGMTEASGILLIAFMIALALGFHGLPSVKACFYRAIFFAAVTASMYFPQRFIEFKVFKFSLLITPLLQLIMVGMGTAMSVHDFIGVVKMPKGVILGTLNQFTIMPLLGFTLASIFHFPPEIAAGVILIGCSP